MKSKEETSKSLSSGNRPSSLKPEGDWSRIFSYHTMDVEIKSAEGIYYSDGWAALNAAITSAV